MHGRSRMTIDPRIPDDEEEARQEGEEEEDEEEECRDGARRVFTDQAGIACTKREAPCDVRRVT